MKDKQKLVEQFAEMGFEDNDVIREFNQKLDFNFEYTSKQLEKNIYTSNNTKTESLCPTGTK
tara:strand:+ start:40 stop:225 length:186 start_codon:yes stop_codon:yes gene_type:complete